MPKWFKSNRSETEDSSWGLPVVSPPEEALGRLTNLERFRPLHSAALEVIGRLEERFEVDRTEGYGLERADFGIASPDVRLTPKDPDAAPIVVTFTTFPGLNVRFGRWFHETYPRCGCDACDESAKGEIERLEERVNDVTAGGFREVVNINIPIISFKSPVQVEASFCPLSEKRNSSEELSWSHVDRRCAREMSGGRRRLDLNWKPWRRREAVILQSSC